MMREIKFRAWTGLNIIHDFLVARPQFADQLKIMTDKDFAKSQYSLNDWVVMQFTGLRDGNGTEVYEGDLIKITSLDKEYPLIDEIHEVRWPSYSVVLYPGDLQEDCDDMQYLTQGDYIYEVIGNIYENPELLNSQP